MNNDELVMQSLAYLEGMQAYHANFGNSKTATALDVVTKELRRLLNEQKQIER